MPRHSGPRGQVPIFTEATKDELFTDLMVRSLKSKVYQPEELVCRKGEEGDCMYFVADGTLAVLNSKGEEVAELGTGSFCGVCDASLYVGACPERPRALITRTLGFRPTTLQGLPQATATETQGGPWLMEPWPLPQLRAALKNPSPPPKKKGVPQLLAVAGQAVHLSQFIWNPPSPPMGTQATHPRVEDSLLKRRTRTCTRRHQPAYSFSLYTLSKAGVYRPPAGGYRPTDSGEPAAVLSDFKARVVRRWLPQRRRP